MLAGPPPPTIAVPHAIRRALPGELPRPVWRSEIGGLTFRGDDVFVKWLPSAHAHLVAQEADRLRWAAPYTWVPEVLDTGADDDGAWLVTATVDGASAVSEPWRAAPETAVRAIATGLRHLHDTLPVPECPFDWGVPGRVARARSWTSEGTSDGLRLADHGVTTVTEALDRLGTPPPVDRLVVCHGDPCAPNTLLAADGSWRAHVDLGMLGTADRWADLAVASWSLEWNYGEGWDTTFWQAYGIAPDRERIAYYRLLWDMCP